MSVPQTCRRRSRNCWYFSGVKLSLNWRRSSGIMSRRDDELAFTHDLLVVHPDVELASDHVDVRGRIPLRASVFPVRVAERDVDTGELFVLEDVADHVFEPYVGPNRKLATPIAVLVGVGIVPEILFQFLVFAEALDDAVPFHANRQRIIFQVAILRAEV